MSPQAPLYIALSLLGGILIPITAALSGAMGRTLGNPNTAAFITIAGQLIFVVNLFWSMWKGKKAEINPWEATTLEWTIPSPPPHDNFGGHPPVVRSGPYEYSVPGAAKDYIMQTEEAGVPAH